MDSGDYRLFFGESSLGNGSKTSFPVNYAGTGKFSPQTPPPNGDPRLPLSNLSVLRQKMDSLRYFLSESVNHNTLLGKDQMNMVSFEITSAIHQVIVNGTALLSFSQNLSDDLVTINRNTVVQADLIDSVSSRVTDKVPVTDLTGSSFSKPSDLPVQTIYEFKPDVTVDMSYDEITTDLGAFRANQIDYSSWMSCRDSKEEEMKNEESEVVELDAVELLAEHVHRCEICGKGFKRDANLRMHMRAHGNQFKTAEALAKPDCVESSRKTRFSCPFMGCNRNKSHKKFQPLKSVICVKNHFKRSHCPKMYSCNRCNKKSFSVVSDLKSHVKHCGESKWRCSCGTTFSRKDKLFGHLALFEGHMPEVEDKAKEVMDIEEDDGKEMVDNEFGSLEYDGFDDWFDGLGGMDKDYLKDMLGSPPVEARMWESFGL